MNLFGGKTAVWEAVSLPVYVTGTFFEDNNFQPCTLNKFSTSWSAKRDYLFTSVNSIKS